jgi:hypothetical protein
MILRGHLLLDLGRRDEVAACFRPALECRCSEPERRFLRRRVAECEKVAGLRSIGPCNLPPFRTRHRSMCTHQGSRSFTGRVAQIDAGCRRTRAFTAEPQRTPNFRRVSSPPQRNLAFSAALR